MASERSKSVIVRTTVRDYLLEAAVRCKALDAYQRLTGETCTVLLYHSVASGASNPYIDGETYAAHMDVLASEFRVLHAEEYLWHLDKGRPFAPRSVLLTLDDGYKNNYTVVRPIMEQRQLPWVLFATTQSLDEPRRPLWPAALRAVLLFTPESRVEVAGASWVLGDTADRLRVFALVLERVSRSSAEETLRSIRDWTSERWEHVPQEYAENFCAMVTPEQLLELSQSRLVEVGGHTRNHPFLTQVRADRLREEIDEPAARLASLLGRRIRMFAYPSGVYGSRDLDHVIRSGFQCAFSVIPVLGRSQRFEIPRIGIYNASAALLRAKVSGLAGALRRLGLSVG